MYKRIFYDIEVSPSKAWMYPPFYEPKFLKEIQPQMIMSISLYDEDEMTTFTIENDFSPKTIRSDKWNDKKICKRIHKYLSSKDKSLVLIGHNSDKFDYPMLNSRFVFWGLPPLPKYQTDDTIKMARKQFNLPSYSLENVGNHLGVGGKHGSHASLWSACLEGDDDKMEWGWEKMRVYNERDVMLTRDVYYKLLPYCKVTNVGKYYDGKVCDRCGERDYQCRGVTETATRFYRRYRCNACTGWFRSGKSYGTRDDALAAPKGE